MNEQETNDYLISQLIAGELDAQGKEELRMRVIADSQLEKDLRERLAMLEVIGHELKSVRMSLPESSRESILRRAREVDALEQVVVMRGARGGKGKFLAVSWKRWVASVSGVAAVLCGGLWYSNQFSVDAPKHPNHSPVVLAPVKPKNYDFEISLTPVQGPPVAAQSGVEVPKHVQSRAMELVAAEGVKAQKIQEDGVDYLAELATSIAKGPMPKEGDFPQLQPRKSVLASVQSELALPVQAGVSSMIWIKRSILEDRQLPVANAVRLEEMMNHFAIHPEGMTSMCKGVSVSTELMSCPWRPSAVLLLVSFKGAKEQGREVQASFVANADHVQAYRLLGYAPAEALEGRSMPTHLPAGVMTSLAIEIEPHEVGRALGKIHWQVDGENAAEVALNYSPDDEPSNDARFAALVCAYGDWLVRKQESGLDKDILSSMVREVQSSCKTDDRIEFLKLVELSIRL